jgi:hypothetical protein
MTAHPKPAKPVRLKGKAMEALRRECFERDGYRCQHLINLRGNMAICAKTVVWERGFWDSGHMAHIKSRGAGGGDTLDNVVTKCAFCHIVREHSKGER